MRRMAGKSPQPAMPEGPSTLNSIAGIVEAGLGDPLNADPLSDRQKTKAGLERLDCMSSLAKKSNEGNLTWAVARILRKILGRN